MEMKGFKRYLALILAVIFILQTGIPVTYAKEVKQTEAHADEKMRDMYNLAILIRFDGEDEYVNDQIAEAGNISNLELIDNTYNKSKYSVQKYYQAVSNQKVNVKTVYLTDAEEGFSSLKLKHTRGYYSPKTEENPEGYTTEMELRRVELLRDWSERVEEALENGAKIKTIDGEEVEFSMLDSDGDGTIDSITLLFSPTEAKYAASWNSPLWAYQSEVYSITLPVDKGILRSKRYYQTSFQNNPLGIYKASDDAAPFMNTATLIHEMGHVFGLADLYPYTGNTAPVYYMSAMANVIKPIAQFVTSREREALGWLDEQNVKPITQAGTYTLPPVKDSRQTGTIAYTLELPGTRKLYLEYRYVEELTVNRFDFNASKRKLYNALGNQVGLAGLNKSGLLAYDVDMTRKVPNNSYGTPALSVVGLKYNTKVDAPRTEGETIYYGGYVISVNGLDKEKITFTVSGNGLKDPGKPVVTNVKLLSPVIEEENPQIFIVRGNEIQFVAEVEGENLTNKEINWSVQGAIAADTTIEEKSGLLKVGRFESTANTLKVIGRSDADSTKFICMEVRPILANQTYSVTYVPGVYGVGKSYSDKKSHGTALQLKGALFTREGFTQTGWSLTEGGEKAYELNASYNKESAVQLYPVWSENPKDALTGTIKINGTLEYGQTLSVVTQDVNSAKLSYQWKRGGKTIGEGKNYVLTAKDIGHVISCEVFAHDKNGVILAATQEEIAKAPTNLVLTASPQLELKNQIILEAEVKGVNDEKPSGTVVFYQDQKKLTDSIAVVHGKASYIWTEVKKGTYNICAEFTPSSEENGYKDSSATVNVEAAGVEPTPTPMPTPKPTQPVPSLKPSITLNRSSVILDTAGTKTVKLSAKVVGTGKKVTYKSSNVKVVKVNAKGNVTAVKAGKATITATANGVKAICNIVVKEASIRLDKSSVVMYTSGEKTEKVRATVTGVNQKVTYKSSNEKVAKVKADGTITAGKEGRARITATANGRTATCTVVVKKTSLTLNKYTSTIYTKGKTTVQLQAAVIGPSKKVTYKSSNPKVVTVSNTGKVTAVGKGTAVITVTSNGIVKRSKIHVVARK